MGVLSALAALLASLLILGAEYLPAELWVRPPVWEPGCRLALVWLVWSLAAALPGKPGERSAGQRAALALAWCSPCACAALALDAAASQVFPLGILALGALTVALSAAAGASRFGRSYLALVLLAGLGLPLLGSVASAAAASGPEWLQSLARLSPFGWLAGAAAGERSLDAWVAPYGLALWLLAGWPAQRVEERS